MMNLNRKTLLLFLLMSIFCVTTLRAQFDAGDPPDGYHITVTGTRNHSGATFTGLWTKDCKQEFILVAYVGDDVEMTCNESAVPSGTRNYKLEIFEDGALTATRNPVLNGTAEKFNFSTPGEKQFKYSYLTGSSFSFTARIIVIRKITKLWVEAAEICTQSYSPGEDYKFKVRTEPAPLDEILIRPKVGTAWNGYECEAVCDYNPNIRFDLVGTLSSTPIKYAGSSSYNYFEMCNIPSPRGPWPYAAPKGGGEEYYISWTDLAPLFGTSLFINGSVTLFDGIQEYKVKLFVPIKAPISPTNGGNSSAFTIWEYNKTKGGSSSGHTAEPFGTIDAPGIETWTPDNNPVVNEGYAKSAGTIRVKDKIVIGKGQSLLIKDMTIEMGENAEIIVESDPSGVQEAGVLTLDNATIKAYQGCGNETNMWRGIVLQGNNSMSQAAMGGDFFKRHQAMLYASKSTISDAQIGVRTYDSTAISKRAGGIIYAFNSNFLNNAVAVDIAGYKSPTPGVTEPYATNFKECTFQSDYYDRMYNFRGFINVESVTGLQVNYCAFQAKYGARSIGFGILATDAGVIVRGGLGTLSPCNFVGLYEAVKVRKASMLNDATLSVSYSNFSNNYTGIYTLGVNNPGISHNTFEIPQLAGRLWPRRNCSGVNIETGSNYNVSNNTFRNLAVSGPTLGSNAVLVWNSGSAENVVQKNTIFNLQQGIISNYKNTNSSMSDPKGLQFLCNVMSNNVNTCLSALGADPAQDGIRVNQGNNSQAAGNSFAHASYDIYNPAGEVGSVNYFYGTRPNAEPSTLLGPVSKFTTMGPDGCDNLPTRPAPPLPGPMGPLLGGAFRASVLGSIDYYTEHFEEVDRDANIHSLLAMLADPYSDLMRVDKYVADGNPTAANELYSSIVNDRGLVGTEAVEFSLWGQKLLDLSIDLNISGKTMRELTPSQIGLLRLVADSANMWAKVRAQNWLSYFDTVQRLNTFLYPSIQPETALMRKTASEVSEDLTEHNNAVYPNPASDYVDVVYTKQSKQDVRPIFELRDAIGKVVYAQVLQDRGTQRLATQKLPTGMYLYRITEGGETIISGKLSKK